MNNGINIASQLVCTFDLQRRIQAWPVIAGQHAAISGFDQDSYRRAAAGNLTCIVEDKIILSSGLHGIFTVPIISAAFQHAVLQSILTGIGITVFSGTEGRYRSIDFKGSRIDLDQVIIGAYRKLSIRLGRLKACRNVQGIPHGCTLRSLPPPRWFLPGGRFMMASILLRDGVLVKYILIAPFS